MNLDQLFEGIEGKVYGQLTSIPVRNISVDSRKIGPGDVFVAKKGLCFDGMDFAKQAISNGAVAIVSSCYNPFLPVVQLIVSDVSVVEPELSLRCYDHPSKDLMVCCVTGTNGKTTTTYIMKYLLDSIGYDAGMLGTIEYVVGASSFKSDLTTPDICSIQRYLRLMRNYGCHAAVLEASSIGIESNRLKGLDIDVAIFTNISLDHLDFHGSFDNYVLSKRKLFENLDSSKLAVINIDDPVGMHIIEHTRARVITYGSENNANYRIKNASFSFEGSLFTLEKNGEEFLIKTNLIGTYNIYNLVSALAALVEWFNIPLLDVLGCVNNIKLPKGRLEPVHVLDKKVFIDYAHTPDALEQVCCTLYHMLSEDGRLIVVFGCGGERDIDKRPLMAAVVEKYGYAVVTSDNPRKELPEDIIKDIVVGFSKENYSVQIDRKQAISYALAFARDKDIVLVAGKGHEDYQIFKHQTKTFDDKNVVLELSQGFVL